MVRHGCILLREHSLPRLFMGDMSVHTHVCVCVCVCVRVNVLTLYMYFKSYLDEQ
jgi:hypothetical protein